MEKQITGKETCNILKISTRTLYNLVKKGKIKAYKVNSKVIYYSLRSVNDYMLGKSHLNYQDNHSTTASK